MEKTRPINLHPDLVITRKDAFDLSRGSDFDKACDTVSLQVVVKGPHYTKKVSLLRTQARARCSSYKNCRQDDWCFLCSSGQNGILFRPEECKSCILFTSEALVTIKGM